MAERWRSRSTHPTQNAIVRVAALASQQSGRVARYQLTHLGVANSTIAGWIKEGHLFRRLPRVYAIGHTAPSDRADLTAALLYAGPGAMLSHATAAWWLGLTDIRPLVIEVSTPRRCHSLPERVIVHGRKTLIRGWHRDLPVAPIAEVLLGYARTARQDRLRKALAEAEYRGWLDVAMLDEHLGRGRPGSAALRPSLAAHDPRLAHTKSELERRLLALCSQYGLPKPEMNVTVEGFLVDAVWRAEKVVVELDGRDAHQSWARIQKDRERELALRMVAFVVLRYVDRQLRRTPGAVAADIAKALRA